LGTLALALTLTLTLRLQLRPGAALPRPARLGGVRALRPRQPLALPGRA
jgi:hypothetical protein